MASEVLSLKQIDSLIEEAKYNEALRQVTRYIETYPEDFDRAEKRISRIMKQKEAFNREAAELVDIIRNDDGSKTDKITKILEMDKFESGPTDNVVDFMNLARRTVTMGDVLVQYDKIMKKGMELVKAESYYDAALKFEEGFSIKNEKSDIVFDVDASMNDTEGRLVVYESDIVLPAAKSLSTVRSIISSSFRDCLSDCEKAYEEYMKAVSEKKLALVSEAYKKVDTAFTSYIRMRNLLIDESIKLRRIESLAESRNPLLMGTSYISFQQRFIIGDYSTPDTGILGSVDAYLNRRVESMKAASSSLALNVFGKVAGRLPESKIYQYANRISDEKKNLQTSWDFFSYVVKLHSLYDLEKTPDGKKVGDEFRTYQRSVVFIEAFLKNLSKAYDDVFFIANENRLSPPYPKNDISSEKISANLEKIASMNKVKADSDYYISKINEEKTAEKKFFDDKVMREQEIAELIKMTGGRIKIDENKKQNTSGVEITNEPVNFLTQIDYFVSIANQNMTESQKLAQELWAYLAYAYSVNGENDYNRFEKLCAECESLLKGKIPDDESDFEARYIKKYPGRAKSMAEKLNEDIAAKKEQLLALRKSLDEGEHFRSQSEDLDKGILLLEKVISDFDLLRVRYNTVISEAEGQIRSYNSILREADEQYELALAAFKKGNFDNANAAVDSASEKYARALDIEFSEQIRKKREETLNKLAMDIQQAEYEKVLREVYDLKDKASTFYYSSNFDGAENLLTAAQAKWASVSIENDPEIDNLLNIVKTVKSISYGRILLPSDPHYPELSYSIDMAKQSFERGLSLKSKDKIDEAKEAFNLDLSNIRNVQNVYPLNQEARLIILKIQRELNPEEFPRLFENQYNAAKMNKNMNQRLADLEDLYEINPKYPGLAQEIYDLKDSLGMFPKKTIKKEVKKSADSKIAEARSAFKAAGDNESILNQALKLADEAIAIDGTNKTAKELKLDIQLKLKKVSNAPAILSQNDEKMYAEAARLFNQRRFTEAKALLDKLLTGSAAQKSRKVIDLYNRVGKRI